MKKIILNKYYLFTTGNIICSNDDGTLPCTCHSLLQNRWFVPVGKPFLSRFPNRERQAGTKSILLSRVVTPTGTKGATSATWLAHPFVPVGVTKGPFFPISFSILFLFQLYFCILIKLMYWNSMCMISTNIYIYIYI